MEWLLFLITFMSIYCFIGIVVLFLVPDLSFKRSAVWRVVVGWPQMLQLRLDYENMECHVYRGTAERVSRNVRIRKVQFNGSCEVFFYDCPTVESYIGHVSEIHKNGFKYLNRHNLMQDEE